MFYYSIDLLRCFINGNSLDFICIQTNIIILQLNGNLRQSLSYKPKNEHIPRQNNRYMLAYLLIIIFCYFLITGISVSSFASRSSRYFFVSFTITGEGAVRRSGSGLPSGVQDIGDVPYYIKGYYRAITATAIYNTR